VGAICQGEGRKFESRLPLHFLSTREPLEYFQGLLLRTIVAVKWPLSPLECPPAHDFSRPYLNHGFAKRPLNADYAAIFDKKGTIWDSIVAIFFVVACNEPVLGCVRIVEIRWTPGFQRAMEKVLAKLRPSYTQTYIAKSGDRQGRPKSYAR